MGPLFNVCILRWQYYNSVTKILPSTLLWMTLGTNMGVYFRSRIKMFSDATAPFITQTASDLEFKLIRLWSQFPPTHSTMVVWVFNHSNWLCSTAGGKYTENAHSNFTLTQTGSSQQLANRLYVEILLLTGTHLRKRGVSRFHTKPLSTLHP